MGHMAPGRVELMQVGAEPSHTSGHIADLVLVVRAATSPRHVLQGEGLVGAQHDDLNGTRLQQHDLVLRGKVSAREGRGGGQVNHQDLHVMPISMMP